MYLARSLSPVLLYGGVGLPRRRTAITCANSPLSRPTYISLLPSEQASLEHLTPIMSSLSLLTSPLRARDRQDGSIFENDVQRRGFVIVIILSLLATVGMFCLIITLVLLKNKRDRRIKKAKMDAEKGSVWPGANKGRYQKVEEDKRDGVWSAEMEMEDRGAYSGAGYGEGREPYRPINTHVS